MESLLGGGGEWLPIAFTVLMGLSMLAYVVLDGFDLGVGLLLPLAKDEDKDIMVASIGPFWDANETWLVLGIGILLVAFPAAHGIVLTALYLPVSLMLLGLILRGVSFEFRAKVVVEHKARWNFAFFAGSALTAFTQGFMLGIYVVGLKYTPATIAFASGVGVCVAVGYAFIGATWLLMKTEGELQRRASRWARRTLGGVAGAMLAVSVATPLVSERVFERWFAMPELLLLSPLPIVSALLFAVLWKLLPALPDKTDTWTPLPFVAACTLFGLASAGVAYSFYPYVIPGQMTIFEAASAPESLLIIFVGACFVLPVIVAYNVLAYTVFRGKATALKYD